ncbi:hypothetical protein HY624_00170 [Candidatus Uhrbacteria bacterium]|nr:hypothetical protein [Candidatus Uhrbacteria bacterium]
MRIPPVSTNALTGVGKSAPVLEDQEAQRGPTKVSAPVSAVGTPGAKVIADDKEARALKAQQDEIDRQEGIGTILDVRA